MNVNDAVLLERWRVQRDADAFATLISRHASMVYGACLRVVRSPGDAEEVAQECFLELMKGPRGVKCIGAWLHTVATRRALDRVKSDTRREQRERRYAESVESSCEPNWDDTRCFVDEAIAALPEDLRAPVVLRFLEGHTHEAIAEALSISRTTARARIDSGIGVIRENLAKRGVLMAAVTLSAGLEAEATTAAPQALIAELGRRVLAIKTGATFWGSVTGAKLVVAAVVAAGLGLAGTWVALGSGDAPGSSPIIADVESDSADEAPQVSTPPAAVTPPVESTGDVVTAVEEAAPLVEDETNPAGWRLDLTPSEKLKPALQSPVNIEFNDIHVKDVVEFLSDSFNVNLVLDPRVVAPELDAGSTLRPDSGRNYVTDGHLTRVSLRDKPLEQALAIITGMLNLTYKTRGNAVWISSSAQITRDMTVPLPSAPFSDGEIIAKIAQPVNVEFEDIHLSDVIQFLASSYRINIELDDSVIMPATRRGEEPSPISGDYVTDGMLPYINLRDVPFSESLYTMTRLVNLSYRVDKEAIYISTPDRLKGAF